MSLRPSLRRLGGGDASEPWTREPVSSPARSEYGGNASAGTPPASRTGVILVAQKRPASASRRGGLFAFWASHPMRDAIRLHRPLHLVVADREQAVELGVVDLIQKLGDVPPGGLLQR